MQLPGKSIIMAICKECMAQGTKWQLPRVGLLAATVVFALSHTQAVT